MSTLTLLHSNLQTELLPKLPHENFTSHAAAWLSSDILASLASIRTHKFSGSGDSKVTTTYFSDNGQLTALSQSGKNIDRLLIVYRDSSGHPISLDFKDSNSSSFSSFWLLSNQQGDIIKILDANWNIVVEYSYDTWGSPIGSPDPSLHPIASLNPFRYRGYVYDEESGLYYLNSRYYRPAWGRFVNADDTDIIMYNALSKGDECQEDARDLEKILETNLMDLKKLPLL